MSSYKDFLNDLKTRLPVSEVVGKYLKLQRSGREYKALSPFTKEKTPSFTINDEKQFWHCFSSGKHGDIISFLTETQNLSFQEAVAELAKMAGLEVPRFRPVSPEIQDRRDALTRIMEAACVWFGEQLASHQGKAAREYLKERGVQDDTAQTFRLGFAPPASNALKQALLKQGFAEERLIEAGLLIKPDEGETYDRFRNRLIFPIEDAQRQVIAFGGRAQDPRQQAKYLNSPETPLFHKRRVLYGLAQARKPAFDKSQLIVVEGYMDVLALHGAGMPQTVGGMGTALTEEQLRLLWRVEREPIICFDGDAAGHRAARNLMERALPEIASGRGIRFAYLPEGRDPDDLIRDEGGAALERVLAKSEPLSEAIYRVEVDAAPSQTPEHKAALEKRLRSLAQSIADSDLRRHYERMFQQRLRDRFWRMNRNRGEPTPLGASGRTPNGAAEQERILLGMMIAFPELLALRREQFEKTHLAETDHIALRDELIHIYDNHDSNDGEISADRICDNASPSFHRLIGRVYGYDEGEKPSGHLFRERFPLARFFAENPEYRLECLDYFLAAQECLAIDGDLERSRREYAEKLSAGDQDAAEKSQRLHFQLHNEFERKMRMLRETSRDLGERLSEIVPESEVDWAAFFSKAFSATPAPSTHDGA